MTNRCRCTHPDHDGTCPNAATWRCPTCGVALCSLCTIPSNYTGDDGKTGHHHPGHSDKNRPYEVISR